MKWPIPVRREAVRLRLAVEIAFWRHGWVWAGVAGLLAATVLVALAARISTGDQREQLRQELRALAEARAALDQSAQQGRSSAGLSSSAVRDSNVLRHAALASVLASNGRAGEQIRLLYRLAAQQQVSISKADFQQSAEGASMERLQIAIPVKATYPQLRRFLESSLKALPNASLDRLSFRRNQVGETQVEARVHFSLWLGSVDRNDRRAVADASVDGERS